jgi:hypothetical protein
MNGDIDSLSSWLALLTGEMIYATVETDGTIVFTVGANRMGLEEARRLVAEAAARGALPPSHAAGPGQPPTHLPI